MATYTKKLHIRKNNIITDICLYTTTSEVGSDYITLNINGNIVYAKLGSTADANASPLRIRKNSSVYAALTQATPPYGSISYTTAGTYTFTTPSGITKIKIALVGGGGGGGRGLYRPDTPVPFIAGGGGGSGYFLTGIYNVIPNTSYTVIVGAGADINASNNAVYGGSSSVIDLITVNGGQSGSVGVTGGMGGVNGTNGNSSNGANQLIAGKGGITPSPYAPYGNGGDGGGPGLSGTASVNGMVKIEWGIGIQ